ncbi:homoserine dehydrogenase [Corallococcus sp. AB049A]|uniref:homoserine dehydrogenase n=1 Tax=Corallococcus sp. AB049A TaxID=2316721 RepID=UPI000EBEE793|nr:homoserine dehydrogenase [Corallococcus sp. AB049A]RKI59447.1 homoserine dehydrogenase [Corallococcus sp. AB049A]
MNPRAVRTVRFLLTGLGNVGVPLLEILQSRASLLMERYRLELLPVGLADSGGAAVAPHGLDIGEVLAVKRARHSVASLPVVGRPGMSGRQLVRDVKADLLLEATPTSFKDGQPGLDITRDALMRGMAAVLASKGPLVLGFQELASLSDLESPGRPPLRFSAAVGGAMPLVNVGRRDLALGKMGRFEGVLNSTSHLLLCRMAEGKSYEAALAEAQALGIAEADPTLDVDGWDTTGKLIILANAVMRVRTTLKDVSVTGMRGVTRAELDAAKAKGGQVLLLARGEPLGGERWEWSVRPTAVDASHPLARLGATELGAVFRSDLHGVHTLITGEQGSRGTSAAMLRDVLEIFPD